MDDTRRDQSQGNNLWQPLPCYIISFMKAKRLAFMLICLVTLSTTGRESRDLLYSAAANNSLRHNK